MENALSMFVLSVVLVVSLLDTEVRCESPSSDISVKYVDQYSPEYLLSLGQTLDSPLLRLLGLVTLCNGQSLCSEWSDWYSCSAETLGMFGIRNRTRLCGDKDPRCRSATKLDVEKQTDWSLCEGNCNSRPSCSEWSTWSTCSAETSGMFGTRNRTRLCGDKATRCPQETQTDQIQCEGFCPVNYNMTKHGFCLKFYRERLNHTASVARCKQDGGYLVNVNSDDKLEDIRATNGRDHLFNIDGKRPTISSPWEYTYGPEPTVLKWASGQPGNRANELCMVLFTKFLRYDATCIYARYFMCEILRDKA